MSSASNSGQPRPEVQAGDGEPQSPEQVVGLRMLEQILTVSTGGAPAAGFVEPADVQALEEVARKLRGEAFGLAPVATELVHAMLEVQFTKAGVPATTLRSMAEQIAATLYDDPTARQGLEALWLGLTQK